MSHREKNRVPAYRLHKQSGQAIVTLSGKDRLLGLYGSAESRQTYDRLLAEWIVNGRRSPIPDATGLSVSRVLAEFWSYAEVHYVDRDGKPSKERENFRVVMAPLRRLYGGIDAINFGPLALKVLQQELIKAEWSRKYINRQLTRIKQMFKWAVSQELVPASVYQALATVSGLRRGKSTATEYAPISPVSDAVVEATLPHISRQVQALVHLQLLTGMRPGEAVLFRGCDLEICDKVWIYRPHFHKNEHRGIERKIPIGPKAQEILHEFWKADLQAYLFSPTEAEAERREELNRQRKTPLSCGNVRGSNVATQPKWSPTERYTTNTYRQAIARACENAFPPPAELKRMRVQGLKGEKSTRWESELEWRNRLGIKWKDLKRWIGDHSWHPNQLRHTAATKLRHEFGIDAAQSILGHRLGSSITEIYAEVDAKKVADIMEKVG